MSWISAARGARATRLVGAIALVAAVLTPVAAHTTVAAAAEPAPPKIASTSYPRFLAPSAMRWRGAYWRAVPAYRWKPATTTGVAKYQVQTWHGVRRGSYIAPARMPELGSEYGVIRSGYQSTIATYPASRTSVAGEVLSGDQVCRRVRTLNAAGTAGVWSAWRCTYAPMGTEELERGFDATEFGHYVRNNGSCCNPLTSARYLTKGVRIKVRTGPTYGKARILIGSTVIGTVDGYAKRYGYKYVTRQRTGNLTGAIKIRSISRYSRPFRLTSLWALRATAPLGSVRVVEKSEPGTAGPFHDPVSNGDTTPPRMTAFSLAPQFPTKRNSNGVYGGTATWKATDDVKVAGYEVNLKWVTNGTSYIAGGTWTTTGTSMPVQVDFPGDTNCYRIRAYDAAVNFSTWSRWRCSYSPLEPMSQWTAGSGYPAGGRIWTSVRQKDEYGAWARTTDRHSAKRLRVQYRTGPTYGRAKAYIGGVYFGTINAYASRYGTRWITLTGEREAHERIRFVPLTKKDVYIGKVHVIPDVTKAVSPGPARS